MEKLESFLENSLLPAIQHLIEINMEMAKTQAVNNASMTKTVEENAKRTADMEAAIHVLSESVSALSTPMTQLIESINQSNQLLGEQTNRLLEMSEVLTENTARLNVLTIAMSAQMKDPGLENSKQKDPL